MTRPSRLAARFLAASGRGARAFAKMDWDYRREFAVVLALAVLAEAAVRLLPLPRVARLFGVSLGTPAVPSQPVPELPAWAMKRIYAVRTVMEGWPVDGNCLRRSLVTGQRLRSLGPHLQLGIAREDGRVIAHAWLEIDGRSLDVSASRYDTLAFG